MGFMDKWVKPAGKTPKGGMMSGKQARQYAQKAKMCKKSGCNDAPGNHQFKFPGAKDYCIEHARNIQNERNKKQEDREAAARRAAREETKRKANEAARKAREARQKRQGK